MMKARSIIGLGIAGFLALGTGIRSCTIVPAGHVGVRDLFGKVSEQEFYSGIHAKNPLASVKKMSIRTQEYTMSIVLEEGKKKGTSDAISALTKEGLKVDLDVTVLYRLNSEKASDLYKTVGIEYPEVIVRPKIREGIRAAVAAYEAKDIYSEKRQELQDKIKTSLIRYLGPRGVEIEDVLLRHVQLPEKVTAAIEDKLQAEQEAQKMQFVLQKEEQDAERRRIEAQGLADAQKTISETLTKEYLQFYFTQTLEKLVGSPNTTFVVTPFDQKLIPMLPLEPKK